MKLKTNSKSSSPAVVTGKSLSRRTLLKGAGAALALPMLDAMTPAFAQSPAPIHRFQTVYIPNGMAMEYWSPKDNGPALEITPVLEPLKNYSDRMLFLSGIQSNYL